MPPSGLPAQAFGVGDLLPFRFLEVVEGFYFALFVRCAFCPPIGQSLLADELLLPLIE